MGTQITPSALYGSGAKVEIQSDGSIQLNAKDGQAVQTTDDKLRIGAGWLEMVEQSAPGLSASGELRMYPDSTSHSLRISVNGGAYGNLGASIASTLLLLKGDGSGNAVAASASDIPAISESGVTNLVTDLGLKAPLASPTFTGTVTAPLLTLSGASAASAPAELLTGAWFTGGTSTTNFPHFLLQATGTTASTTWSTAGTGIGVNAVTGFTGNLIDLELAGVSKFKIDSTGALTASAKIATSNDMEFGVGRALYFGPSGSGNGRLQNNADAQIGIIGRVNTTQSFAFGGFTNSFAQVLHDAVNGLTLQSAAGTSTWNDASTAISGTVANRYLFGIAAPTLTATNTSVTNTVASTFYIGGAPTDSTNTTSTTKYALNVAGGTTLLGGGLKGTTTNDNATAGNVGEYISASVVQGSATTLTTATPKTVTSISLTAGDWDVTAIGSITGASTGTEFDVAISPNTNSMTGTVLGDTRCQTPTVSLAGSDATLMVPAVRISISSTTTYYLVVQETFTVGSPAAYGRISARRVR